MSKVKVSIEGHYEVREFAFGKDYVWQPGHALIECDCGQTLDADERHTICPNCGTDHTDVVRQVVGRHLSEDVLHPWHPDYESWVAHRKKSYGESEDYASELDDLK